MAICPLFGITSLVVAMHDVEHCEGQLRESLAGALARADVDIKATVWENEFVAPQWLDPNAVGIGR